MTYRGSCPDCRAPLTWTGAPPPRGRCDACGAGFLLTVSDEPGSGEDQAVELVPWRESRPGWLAARGLGRPILWGLIAGLALVVGAFLLAIVFLVAPASSVSTLFMGFFVLALGLALVAGLVIVLSIVVVRLVLGRELASGAAWSRSVKAVSAGVAALALVGLGIRAATALLAAHPIGPSPLLVTLVTLAEGFACVAAGWITARLAPGAPYRHALCVTLVVVIVSAGAVLFATPRIEAVAGALVYGLALLPLLLGARLGRASTR